MPIRKFVLKEIIKDMSNLVPTVQDEISLETATRIINDTQTVAHRSERVVKQT